MSAYQKFLEAKGLSGSDAEDFDAFAVRKTKRIELYLLVWAELEPLYAQWLKSRGKP